MSDKTDRDPDATHVCAEVCGAECCSGAIYLREEDVHQLREAGHESFVTEEDGSRVMKTTDSGQCVFLGEDNRCRVYQSRPLDCRLFPFGFQIEGDQLEVVLAECPLSQHLDESTLEEMTDEAVWRIRDFHVDELHEYDNLQFTCDVKVRRRLALSELR